MCIQENLNKDNKINTKTFLKIFKLYVSKKHETSIQYIINFFFFKIKHSENANTQKITEIQMKASIFSE